MSNWQTWLSTTGTSTTVTGLAAATSYDYRVTASNAGGAGTPSNTLTTSTAAAPSGGGPATPPVQFSVDATPLHNPGTQPAGSVTVTPGGTTLDVLTANNAAGTTFWLQAGTHRLTAGQYTSVNAKAGNTYIGANGAILSGNNSNQYAFSGNVSNVTIKYLEITGFVCPTQEFTINHDAAPNWTISNCNIHDNKGAAIGIGSSAVIDTCWLHNNQQYGFSSYKPPVNNGAGSAITNVTINGCEISYNGDITLEVNPDGSWTGCGCTGGGKFWDTQGITVTNCWVHHNPSVGIWADTNNIDFTVQNCYINDNWSPGIMYEISWNFCIENNTLARNSIWQAAKNGDGFPRAAIYISESGGDAAVSSNYSTSYIRNNTFIDNWDDICLWESADRFCNSPANTSGKIYKPKGHGATLAGCNDPTAKNLTVQLTAGQPTFTVTSGTLAWDGWQSSDEGRNCSGTGIPAGAKLIEPTEPSSGQGVTDATHGRMTVNATATTTTTMTLAAGTINVEPMFSACRWKTQNVSITGNQQNSNSATIKSIAATFGYGVPAVNTGKIAVISQWGTYPSWSPYQGATVETNISQHQNNVWANNTYVGNYEWHRGDNGTAYTFAQWQAFGQDAGSTLNGSGPPSGSKTLVNVAVASDNLTHTGGSTPPGTCTSPNWIGSGTSDGVSYGSYYVHNNMWNAGADPGGTPTETLSACNYNSWYVTARLANTTATVITYPNVHQDFGTNWGCGLCDGPQISSFNTLTSTFAGSGPGAGIYNVAYDIWINNVNYDSSHRELMIWTEYSGLTDPGGIPLLVSNITVDGRNWDLYVSGSYIAYLIRGGPVKSGTINVKAFWQDLVNRGICHTTDTLAQLCYGIEFRSTASTTQRFDCTDFSITTTGGGGGGGGGNTCTTPTWTNTITSPGGPGTTLGAYYAQNQFFEAGGSQTMAVCNYNSWYVLDTQPNTTSVKCYPNVHMDFSSHPAISTFSTITSTWAASIAHVGICEAAYDIWLYSWNYGSGFEIMIWTENYNQRPLGNIVATNQNAGGLNFTLWYGSTGAAPAGCASLVLTNTVTSGTVDIKAIFNYLIGRGYFNNSAPLWQICYGFEVCSTNNTQQRYDVTDFSVTHSP